MNFDFHFMLIAMKAALRYTPVTLLLAFVPFTLGIILGTFIALARLFQFKVLARGMQVLPKAYRWYCKS